MKAIAKLKVSPLKFFFFFSMLLGVAGCSKEKTVNGQVFIVTAGAQNIKMGLVDIFLLDEKPANDLASKIETAREEIDKKIRLIDAELTTLSNRTVGFALWAKDMQERTRNRSLANETSNHAFTAEELKVMSADLDKLKEFSDFAEETKVSVPKLLDDKKRLEQDQLNLVNEYLITNAPACFTKTTTDADGKFFLKVPQKGHFAVLCQASRQVGSTAEHYAWFCWLPKGEIPNPFLLSNNNQVTQNRSDGVLSAIPK